MRIFLFLGFVLFVGSLESHQGVLVMDEMHKIMEASPCRIAMNGGVCALDMSNWEAMGHEAFHQGPLRQWVEIACNTNLPSFVISKGFYRINEEAVPRNSSVQNPSTSGMEAQHSFTLSPAGKSAYVRSSGGLLSFLGHENLEAIHTH